MIVQINAQELFFNAVYYVHYGVGNDTTGTGGVNTPYKTVAKALTVCASAGDAIVLLADELSGAEMTVEKSIAFIGNGFKFSGFLWLRSPCSCYQLVFAQGPMSWSESNQTYTFHNCVFQMTSTYINTGCSFVGNSYVTNGIVQFNNCVFNTVTSCYIASFAYENNVCNFANCGMIAPIENYYTWSGRSPWGLVKQMCLESNFTVDASYNVQYAGTWQGVGVGQNPDGSDAHVGIYGGPFAWGEWELAASGMRFINQFTWNLGAQRFKAYEGLSKEWEQLLVDGYRPYLWDPGAENWARPPEIHAQRKTLKYIQRS